MFSIYPATELSLEFCFLDEESNIGESSTMIKKCNNGITSKIDFTFYLSDNRFVSSEK